MAFLNYTEAKLLSVWLSPSPHNIVETIRKKFATNGGVDTTVNSTVYFLDAINDFPLKEFQNTIPLDNKVVYDNIRISTCLDLQEMMQTVTKIMQQLTMNVLQKQNSNQESHKPVEILLLINGLNVMFQNTQIKETAPIALLRLRDILLKLRFTANNPQSDGSNLKAAVIFPEEEIIKFSSNQGGEINNNNKRAKRGISNDGNTLAQYIAKFYADAVI